jgi:hypothetical protein
VFIGLPVGIFALQIDDHRVAEVHAAAFDRFESRGSFPEPLQGEIHGLRLDVRCRPPERQAGVVACFKRRDRVERRRERQRLAFVHSDVAHIRRLDRLHAPLTKGVVYGARNQIVRDVVQNLVAVPLFDDPCGRLPWTKAGNPRAARVAFGHTVDFGVDDIGRDFHAKILAGFVDVDELCLHPPPRLRRYGATSCTGVTCRF